LDVCPGSPFIVIRVFTGFLLLVNGKVTVPTLWRFAHLILGGVVDSMVALVEGCRALLRSWESGQRYCNMFCNSRRRQP